MKISKRILALSVVGTLALSACSSSHENTAADTAPVYGYAEETAAAAVEGAPAPAAAAPSSKSADAAERSDSPVMAFAAETAAAADDLSGAEFYEMPATTAAMMMVLRFISRS